mmetsp:Transcript_79034/g.223439  ORF Transcript_79034/g.223439 Transcript_79034/m.223439 type:complete len:312 (+) Transcript_79034:542-1477(+)
MDCEPLGHLALLHADRAEDAAAGADLPAGVVEAQGISVGASHHLAELQQVLQLPVARDLVALEFTNNGRLCGRNVAKHQLHGDWLPSARKPGPGRSLRRLARGRSLRQQQARGHGRGREVGADGPAVGAVGVHVGGHRRCRPRQGNGLVPDLLARDPPHTHLGLWMPHCGPGDLGFHRRVSPWRGVAHAQRKGAHCLGLLPVRPVGHAAVHLAMLRRRVRSLRGQLRGADVVLDPDMWAARHVPPLHLAGHGWPGRSRGPQEHLGRHRQPLLRAVRRLRRPLQVDGALHRGVGRPRGAREAMLRRALAKNR